MSSSGARIDTTPLPCMNACASLTALRLLAHSSYTVLDSSDHTVFLHVNHDGQGEGWGHVYTSNSYGLNYTLSLPGNRRAANGKCDFEKVSQCTVSASALSLWDGASFSSHPLDYQLETVCTKAVRRCGGGNDNALRITHPSNYTYIPRTHPLSYCDLSDGGPGRSLHRQLHRGTARDRESGHGLRRPRLHQRPIDM